MMSVPTTTTTTTIVNRRTRRTISRRSSSSSSSITSSRNCCCRLSSNNRRREVVEVVVKNYDDVRTTTTKKTTTTTKRKMTSTSTMSFALKKKMMMVVLASAIVVVFNMVMSPPSWSPSSIGGVLVVAAADAATATEDDATTTTTSITMVDTSPRKSPTPPTIIDTTSSSSYSKESMNGSSDLLVDDESTTTAETATAASDTDTIILEKFMGRTISSFDEYVQFKKEVLQAHEEEDEEEHHGRWGAAASSSRTLGDSDGVSSEISLSLSPPSMSFLLDDLHRSLQRAVAESGNAENNNEIIEFSNNAGSSSNNNNDVVSSRADTFSWGICCVCVIATPGPGGFTRCSCTCPSNPTDPLPPAAPPTVVIVTPEPTPQPTPVPSRSPSTSPSASPSSAPTTSPSDSPSSSPTRSPSAQPSASPTERPSSSPSSRPSASPSKSPSSVPSSSPSKSPSRTPSTSPSNVPTTTPSGSPTQSPTQIPTVACNICGAQSGGTLVPGTESQLVEDSLVDPVFPPPDFVICSEIYDLGINDRLTAEQCTTFREQVVNGNGCTCVYQPCSVCGPVDFVTMPMGVYGSPNIGGTSRCAAIELIGSMGGYSPQQCTFLQFDFAFRNTCGCSNTMAPTDPPDPTEAPVMPSPPPTLVPTANPTLPPTALPTSEPTLRPTPDPTPAPTPVPLVVCTICRDPGDVIMFPDALLAMPPPMGTLTCGDAQAMALSGNYTAEFCLTAQLLAAAQDRCGCSPPGGTPVPTSAPNQPSVMCNNGELQVDYALDLVDPAGFQYELTNGVTLVPSSPVPQSVSGTACVPMANAGTLNAVLFQFDQIGSGRLDGNIASFGLTLSVPGAATPVIQSRFISSSDIDFSTRPDGNTGGGCFYTFGSNGIGCAKCRWNGGTDIEEFVTTDCTGAPF